MTIAPSHDDAVEESPDAHEATGLHDKKGSLLPVIRIIPKAAYDNPTWKGLAYFGRDLVVYGAIVAALMLTDNPFAVVALWVVSGLSISSLFIVGHDAAHEALFSSKRLNSIVGHAAMLPSWHVYEGWVLGHNRIHHGYTVRQGFDFVWHPYTAAQYRDMNTFQRLRHRLEWSWLGAGAYYTREVWMAKMMVGKPPARYVTKIRRDRWIVTAFVLATWALLAVYGVAATGAWWGAVWLPVKVSVIPFVCFQYVIGSVVHVHHVQPGIRWWSRREWTKFKGQMEGTTILRAPFGLNFFFHWIMVHIPHHVDMRIPMYNLELAADAIKENFPDFVHDDKLRFRDYVKNTKTCKLYDFDEGRWLSYDEALAGGDAVAEAPLVDAS